MTSFFRFTAVIFLLSIVGCSGDASVDSGPDPDPEPEEEVRTFRMGVAGQVPRNWPTPSADDWTDLFENIPEYGELWGVHTGWNAGDRDESGVPVVVDVTFQAHPDVDAYVAVGVEPDRLSDAEADEYFIVHRDAFVAVCREIARRHQPGIFLIGIEINRFFEKSPAGFDAFLDTYADAYAAIKSESPSTLIGSNFQMDYMRGGGVRSGVSHDPHWDLLNRFDGRLELATFTAYPFLDYDAPGEIPDTYFDEIRSHTSRPIMITETGWPTEPLHGIEGSEAAQLDFLKMLDAKAAELSFHSVIWAFPHDPEDGTAGGLFDHVSMKTNAGVPKQAFAYWQELRARPLP